MSFLMKCILTVLIIAIAHPIIKVAITIVAAILGIHSSFTVSGEVAGVVCIIIWYFFVFSVKSRGNYASINDVRNAASAVHSRVEAASDKRAQELADKFTNR